MSADGHCAERQHGPGLPTAVGTLVGPSSSWVGWACHVPCAMCHVPRGKLRAHPGDCLGQHVAQSEGAPGGRDCPGRGALSPDGARGALGSQGDAVSQPGSLGRPTLRLPNTAPAPALGDRPGPLVGFSLWGGPRSRPSSQAASRGFPANALTNSGAAERPL